MKEMKGNDKLISVILPVYNGAKTIKRAVESILNQTYWNYELIIINDGSTDETANILASFHDERIRILHQKNCGLVESLNRGIRESHGNYIARMDADDAALPERFQKQISFMKKNPSVGAVGTAVKVMYGNGIERIRRRPLDTAAIKKNIVRVCPLSHSSAMIRKEVFDKVGLYDASKDGSKQLLVEDYDLWVRILAANYDMANLSDVLMLYYREPNSIPRGRFLLKRIRQQILTRMDVIRKLNLGYAAYFNIFPVIFFSVLSYYGIRLDGIFNLLSSHNMTLIAERLKERNA